MKSSIHKHRVLQRIESLLQPSSRPDVCTSCLRVSPIAPRRTFTTAPFRLQRQPIDDPKFISLVDIPVQLVRKRSRHGWGLIILALIPIGAFALGTWQVQRLKWKTALVARFEDRLIRPPLPLPPFIDPDEIPNFDYRRVTARGVFRHEGEMLIGPRLHDGTNGYLVVTPLVRSGSEGGLTGDGKNGGSTILINRGWVSKEMANIRTRREAGGERAVPMGEVTVEGLLRIPWKKNMFTPNNNLETGEFYFPDVQEMAKFSGSEPVWVEETLEPDLLDLLNREEKGIPIGRAAEVNLRNNHMQYIVTWYALGFATSIMFWLVVKKPKSGIQQRVRQSSQWS